MAHFPTVGILQGIRDNENDSTASEKDVEKMYGTFNEDIDELDELRQYVDINDGNVEAQIARFYSRHRALFIMLLLTQFILEIALNTYLLVATPSRVN